MEKIAYALSLLSYLLLLAEHVRHTSDTHEQNLS